MYIILLYLCLGNSSRIYYSVTAPKGPCYVKGFCLLACIPHESGIKRQSFSSTLYFPKLGLVSRAEFGSQCSPAPQPVLWARNNTCSGERRPFSCWHFCGWLLKAWAWRGTLGSYLSSRAWGTRRRTEAEGCCGERCGLWSARKQRSLERPPKLTEYLGWAAPTLQMHLISWLPCSLSHLSTGHCLVPNRGAVLSQIPDISEAGRNALVKIKSSRWGKNSVLIFRAVHWGYWQR